MGTSHRSCYDFKMRFGGRALRLSTILLVVAKAVAAQQDAKLKDLPDAPAPKQEQAAKHENPIGTTFEVLTRRSVFFPDLATNPGPLTTQQKSELFVDKSIAPSRLLASAVGAGISQAIDSLPAYGQGMAGYGKRFGSSLASGTSSELFSTFLFASLFHRDPRFFISSRGGHWRRIGYGVSRLVVTRTDAGTEGANWSGLLGPLFAESLANSYLPSAEQTSGRTFRRYGIRLGSNAGANILKEYWPSIVRNLRIQKIAPSLNPDSGPSPSPPASPRPLF